MKLDRFAAALALLVVLSASALAPSAYAQPNDGGLATPAAPGTGAAQPSAAKKGTPARVDLTGAWTAERDTGAPGAPGSFIFAKLGGKGDAAAAVDDYTVHVVANAADSGAVAQANVSAVFDGNKLTVTWQPTPGFTGKVTDATAPTTGTTKTPASVKTLVYEHSADDDFDRLTLASGSELPNGVAAPGELRHPKPPQVIFPAEWEQSEEILWGYVDQFSVSLIYRAALKGCAGNGETVKHRFYVATDADEHQLSYEFGEEFGKGPAMGLILYRRYGIGSVWMRDYGPWTVRRKKDNQRVLGDMGYYDNRPGDDRMPVDYAKLKGWDRLDLSSLKIEGGNIMSDGKGRCFCSVRTLEGQNTGANDSQQAVEASLRQVGAKEVFFFERMPAPEGTGHMDMFSKLMDEKNVLVGRHEDPRYAPVLERNAARFAALGYKVTRVDFARPSMVTGVGSEGLGLMTYTNSLFVGKTVLVTAFKDKERDKAALDAYRSLGWKPVGIDVRSIIAANGAIHCITMQVPAR